MEGVLRPLLADDETPTRFAHDHDLPAPPHVIRAAAVALHRAGPQAFGADTSPPVTRSDWVELVVATVRNDLEQRHHRLVAAQDALRHLRRPKTTLRALGALVRRVISAEVALDDGDAYELVVRARRLVLAGPDVRGGWDIGTGGAAEEALALVARVAIALAQARPRLDAPGIPIELVESVIAGSLPSGRGAASTLLFDDEIGPLGISPSGRLVSSNARFGPVVVVGQSGSGKTQLLTSVGQVSRDALMITTTKCEDWRAILTGADGDVFLLNATEDVTGIEDIATSVGFDAIAGVRTQADARRLADLVVEAELGDNSAMSDGSFWAKAAADLAWPLILFAAHNDERLTDVRRRMMAEDFDAPRRWLRAHGEDLADATLATYLSLYDRTRSSIQVTAGTAFRPYADGLNGCLDVHPHVDLEALLRDGGKLVVYSNDRTAAFTRSFYVSVLDAIVNTAARLTLEGWTRKVTCLLDECANVVAHPDLPQIAAIAPGMGLNLVTAFQDVAQLVRAFGESGGRELFNNAGAVVVYPGSTDLWLRQVLGSLSPVRIYRDADGNNVGTDAGLPIAPPRPGEVLVLDGFGRVSTARQVRSALEPALVADRQERMVRHSVEFAELLAVQAPPGTPRTEPTPERAAEPAPEPAVGTTRPSRSPSARHDRRRTR